MRLKILAGLAVAASLAGVAMVPGEAMAVTCPKGSLRENQSADSIAECNINPTHDNEKLMSSIDTVISFVLGALGVVAVVVIIVGGIGFVTSQGDSAKVTKAKNTILYGIIGLVVALLAFAIVNFVLKGISSDSSGGGTPKKCADDEVLVDGECKKK